MSGPITLRRMALAAPAAVLLTALLAPSAQAATPEPGASDGFSMGSTSGSAGIVVPPVAGDGYKTSAYYKLAQCNKHGLRLEDSNVLDKSADEDGRTAQMRPNPNFTYTPVILVHGWTGDRSAWGGTAKNMNGNIGGDYTEYEALDRSLVGQLKSARGVAVYTFDYSAYNDTWVTIPQIRDYLREAINCTYTATGNKVVGIAHSMGGLALRSALGDSAVANKVRDIYTFDTPNTGAFEQYGADTALGVARTGAEIGSEGAQGAADAAFAGNPSYNTAKIAASMLAKMAMKYAYCHLQTFNLGMKEVELWKKNDQNWKNGDCVYTTQAIAMTSLLPGSTQLGQLPTWEDIKKKAPGLKITSLTGDISLHYAESYSSYFALQTGTTESNVNTDLTIADLGDLVVGTESAHKWSDDEIQLDCNVTWRVYSSGWYDYAAGSVPGDPNLSGSGSGNGPLEWGYEGMQGFMDCWHGAVVQSSKLVQRLYRHDEGDTSGLYNYSPIAIDARNGDFPAPHDWNFSNWIVKPGEVGPLKLGMSPSEISEYTGGVYDMNASSTVDGEYDIWGGMFEKAGITIDNDKAGVDGKARTFYVSPGSGAISGHISDWKNMLPKTDKGIRVADPQAKVVAAYGLSPKKEKNHPGFSRAYTGSGNQRMGFAFYHGKLISISVGPGDAMMINPMFLSGFGIE
jgi:pimeloyl-ACP methyl ester carboxylesterase